ncbi:thiamine pyrophosphate-dependent enzyme [Nonomuraea sp. NPDC050790]|uniref:thiamine pyrophosphate-dependent enzyme n=1 Tax=Nonomuraea sp. NPDC050790 TaxID=3364371 RepID=UPI0037A6FFB0
MSTTSRAIADWMRLRDLTTVFGGPGADACPVDAYTDDVHRVRGLHEAVVVAMADGYASVTGRPALVDLGCAAHASGAVLGAAANRTPLIVTAGQGHGGDGCRPAAKWSCAPAPRDVPAALEWAYHVALTPPRGPVFLSLPTDLGAEADLVPRIRPLAASAAPDPVALAVLAERLDRARSPVLVVGADVDASGGWAAAVELAERCALPVWEAARSGRVSFPQSHPHYRGALLPGPGAAARQLAGHDLVLAAGVPPPEDVTAVLLTSDPSGAAYGDVIVGEVRQALAALSELTKVRQEPLPGTWPAPSPAPRGSRPMSLRTALAAVAAGAPEETVWVCESPPSRPAFHDQIRINRPGSFLCAAGGGAGHGLPAAIGAQLGEPSRPVVAVVGDGSLQHAVAALWSAAAYRVPLTVVVLTDGTQAMLRWLSRLDGAGPGADLCAIAKGYGLAASHVESAEALTAAVRIATASDLPMLVEVPVNGP